MKKRGKCAKSQRRKGPWLPGSFPGNGSRFSKLNFFPSQGRQAPSAPGRLHCLQVSLHHRIRTSEPAGADIAGRERTVGAVVGTDHMMPRAQIPPDLPCPPRLCSALRSLQDLDFIHFYVFLSVFLFLGARTSGWPSLIVATGRGPRFHVSEWCSFEYVHADKIFLYSFPPPRQLPTAPPPPSPPTDSTAETRLNMVAVLSMAI
ncbi:hypothetical protein LY76DRAFT_348988 [Colletotrichum caudatum]|nr:hypothetical protein LY76DRAFT_348988 [Colletotrichum caudatum]